MKRILIPAAFMASCVSSMSPKPAVPPPLAECAKGWLYVMRDTNCDAARLDARPEANQSDCYQRNFFAFLEGAVEYEMIVAHSPSLGTMSTVGDVVKRQYTMTDASITYVPPGGERGTSTASCTVDGNLKISYLTLGKASAGWTAALQQQVGKDSTAWTAAPVRP